MDATTERKSREKVNAELAAMPIYHPFIPLGDIDNILTKHGFNELEPAIYCGRQGRSNEKIGERSYLSLTWYKMEESGRYEVVAYVS